jgi:hypothetical protein
VREMETRMDFAAPLVKKKVEGRRPRECGGRN